LSRSAHTSIRNKLDDTLAASGNPLEGRWPNSWRGRWIWDHSPEESYWWRSQGAQPHFTYLRVVFDLDETPVSPLLVRTTCDSRYALYVNGGLVGRGPVRGEPEFLGWDEHDLSPWVRRGRNVIVALCHFYGVAGPWWVPAAPLGTLGRGSFCLETAPASPVRLQSDNLWKALEAPWVPSDRRGMHNVPPEVIDGRRTPVGLHDPSADDGSWANAIVLSGRGHGTVLDRPPAAPYMTPLPRPIPQLSSRLHAPRLVATHAVAVDVSEDPVDTWATVAVETGGDRLLTVLDVGGIVLGHVRLTVIGSAGEVVDVVAGEDLRPDGLPELRPRNWAGRYIAAGTETVEHVAFFDPVGLRFLAVHHSPQVQVTVDVEETTYPRTGDPQFECDDDHLTSLWGAGLRTVEVCSTDAFLDCPGREQRAWVSDAYPQILVSLVTNPDLRLVRHHLALTARSRLPSGLLAGAAACDFSHIGFTMPEYSLHWIRSLAAYWEYTGDEGFVGGLLPIADQVIERYEAQRGASGLLENFPGWIFLDWAQVGRDVVTAAHDSLYVAALADYGRLPGATNVLGLITQTRQAFERLWDRARGVYIDTIDADGRPGRRVSQHTNAAALLAGLVPPERVEGVIDRIVDPALMGGGGRLVLTPTPDAWRDQPDAHDRIPTYQYSAPERFDPEADMVEAQPWFCRFLHEAFARHGRRDLVVRSLRRWRLQPGHGTLGEFWDAAPGGASRCHGWAASPTFDLITQVLGVRPLAPGCTRVIVDPFLGDLTWARGRIATLPGWLSVDLKESTLTLDIPAGMTAVVAGHELSAGREVLER